MQQPLMQERLDFPGLLEMGVRIDALSKGQAAQMQSFGYVGGELP